MTEVIRYSAFTLNGEGGNPAGVVLDATGMDDRAMLEVAAEVGYSESAFLFPRTNEPNVYDVRYFSAVAEVPFCGHATVAAAVALVERQPADQVIFHTRAGFVSVNTRSSELGTVAELSSVAPRVSEPADDLVDRVLAALGWSRDDLDPRYPIRLANAGAEHLILVTRTYERLADLDYDYDALKTVMVEHDLTTCQLIWPESRKRYRARNPFPTGGVVEDPATGAAAAAFGGYLRAIGKIGTAARFSIVQGAEIGRPSLLEVEVIGGEPGVRVSGVAVRIPG